jgi:FkbM family methyltransferase
VSQKFSIVTPSFNQGQFLPFNLDSVREQTHPDIEHIVVDPGSTDGSRETAEAADGIILIAEPDRGQSDGITKGFARSTGDYLTWLNSDDFYPDALVLEKVAAAFEINPDADIIYGKVDFVDEEGKFLRKGYVNPNQAELLDSFAYQVGIVQPGVFMRRSVFEKIGGPSEQYEYCMDYEYWVRMATSGLKWVYLDETLAHHRWWGGMKTSKGRDQSLVEHMRVCANYFGYIHWKWLDRYAEYLTSSLDGVVNHNYKPDPLAKSDNAHRTVRRFVTQEMLRLLESSDKPEERATLNYINKHAPDLARYVWNAVELDGLETTSPDPDAHKRPAWHVMDATDSRGHPYKSYNVTDNFHRCFDANWYHDAKERGVRKLVSLSKWRRDVCVIVGNGPSLNQTDLSLLKDADVIISNFATLNPQLFELASILTVTNNLVAQQGRVDFNNARKPKVFPIWLSNDLNETVETAFVEATVRPMFNESLDGVFSWRSTVSFFNMQLAFALGYKKVLLVGFDHSYVQPQSVKEGDLIKQDKDDDNHFDPRYFKDKVWQAADTDNMEATYKLARAAFDAAGREIVNCTVGGRLEVFRRGDLSTEIAVAGQASPAAIAPNTNEIKTQKKLDRLIAKLPQDLRDPIFLPTAQIPLNAQLEGLTKVKSLFNGELDKIYRPRLQALKADRKARRCFIIGNGPSLKHTDLSLLRDEVTFAMNGFFLKMPDLDWAPTYYVVEDHLVAEDRADEINALYGPTKLFPAHLRYVLEPDDKTIFFEHRKRVSFPLGFDFSFKADAHTYAGGTVTFTCMQLAAYLGFDEIYLVGVDASYEIPNDAKLGGDARVKELDMMSDDPNHFHPDYFGKGKRWHEPNVDIMLGAYEEAQQACDARGIKIVNATVGGKLEVFPRTDYAQLFSGKARLPRILLIDMTRIGDASATGELKATLFADWPANRLMQLHLESGTNIGLTYNCRTTAFADPLRSDGRAIDESVEAFAPDLILYRPTPRTDILHEKAMRLIAKFDLPLLTWIMDDWPAALELDDPEAFTRLDAEWRALLDRSSVRLSISDAMSDAFSRRYGFPFIAVANGVNVTEWPKPVRQKASGPLSVRYAGSLAENMTLSSVRLVAEAVEQLADEGIDITYEIKTRDLWKRVAAPHFKGFRHTKFIVADLEPKAYRAWLSGADIVVIGYNFDAESKSYTKHSLANKLPECLASGATLLAVGPPDVATISILNDLDCGVRITKDDAEEVASVLRSLAASPEERFRLAIEAQAIAFEKFNVEDVRDKFESALQIAVTTDRRMIGKPRSASAHVDETAVVAHLYRNRKGPSHVMLDVGAHVGTSAAYFHKLGWSIHCFEPDAKNRAKLMERFNGVDTVTIDPRAVSNEPAKGICFFTSPESTGISGLLAFRDTHAESDRVDVTTLTEIVSTRGISRVDFLKIDVEGFDLNVLKGTPWETVLPDVVECEFEDAKTLKLGHTWTDVAEFLRERGYTVYVSEWHPIVRYGIGHDWRRVVPYEGHSMSPNAWGNFLAFRDDPGYEAVANAFDELLSYRKTPAPAPESKPALNSNKKNETESSVPMLKITPPHALPTPVAASAKPLWYRKFAERIHDVSPRLFSLLRFARRAAVHIVSRRVLLIPLLLVTALLVAALVSPELSAYRPWIVIAAAGGLLSILIAYIAFRSHAHAESLHIEVNALRRDSGQLRERLATAQTLMAKSALTATQEFVDNALRETIMPRIEAVRAAGVAERRRTDTILESENERKVELDRMSAALTAASTKVETALEEIERLNSMDKQLNQLVSALEDRVTKREATVEALTIKLEALGERAIGSAALAAVNDALTERLNTGIGSLEDSLSKIDKWSQFNNANWYQHFNRRLSSDHIKLLETEWRKRLSVPVSKAVVGYMATRACEIERQLDGRLATSIEDIILRSLVARAVKGKRIDVLEIGTLFGTGAAIMFDALANHYEEIHFTLLDPLEGYYNASQADILTGQPIDEHTLRRNLSRAGMTEDQFTLIKRLSTETEAIADAGMRQYDVLVIDADHSYAGVKTDFENYAQFVKLGGYIIFDDYSSPDWPDVQAYVDSELATVDYITRVGASWRTCIYRVVKTPASGRKSASDSRPRSRKSIEKIESDPTIAE